MGTIAQGILLPFLGTVLGSGCVLLFRRAFGPSIQRALTGFAAGVMMAACVWSLLIPALEETGHLGKWGFLPVSIGFLLGIGFLLVLDRLIPHLHMHATESEGVHANLPRNTMLMLAVTLHNIPEGMAVGVVYAGLAYGDAQISPTAALALSLGIAIQNLPEGAILSMPLYASGVKKHRAFLYGALSGVAEPIGAVLTILAAGLLVPLMPYLLSFAAGAMLYVVVEELIPEMSAGRHSNIGTIAFSLGFVGMMVLDTALG